MEWIFVTAVLVLFVYHRTFRRVVSWLALLAALGGALLVAWMEGWWPPVSLGPLIQGGLWWSTMALCLWWGTTLARALWDPKSRAILRRHLSAAWHAPQPPPPSHGA